MYWIFLIRVLVTLGQGNQEAWEECIKQGNGSDYDCYTCDQLFDPNKEFSMKDPDLEVLEIKD